MKTFWFMELIFIKIYLTINMCERNIGNESYIRVQGDKEEWSCIVTSIAFQIERNVKHARPVRPFFFKKSYWQYFLFYFYIVLCKKSLYWNIENLEKNKLINFW